MSFRALVTSRGSDGELTSRVELLDDTDLPQGEVTVDIDWAGLNYKDGLILTGSGNMVRDFPHVAGIDFAGTVSASEDPRYTIGQEVVLTGWRVGETHWGGYAQKARVKGDWLVPLPQGFSTRDAMMLGTAGLTAMLAIERIEAEGVNAGAGPVLVTGAAGGVGTIAIMLLAKLGYEVEALSGRPEHCETLKGLGATSVLDRATFLAEPDKPLASARWAGAVDTVGGAILGKVLSRMQYDGAVASIGRAAGAELSTTVLPFILRGISLIGIESVMRPAAPRAAAWQRLARLFDATAYEPLVEEIGLDQLPAAAERILAGQVKGRVLVNPHQR